MVTNTLEAKAGSIFIFFRATGTRIPNRPATIIFKTIDTAINSDRFIYMIQFVHVLAFLPMFARSLLGANMSNCVIKIMLKTENNVFMDIFPVDCFKCN